jgi:hypothetical protein
LTDLVRQRCFNHPHREAVARCPECGRYFCRECITEHEGRVLCASCLTRLVSPKTKSKGRLAVVGRIAQTSFGLLIIWIVFYYIGRLLLLIPSSFHEGTIWKEVFW